MDREPSEEELRAAGAAFEDVQIDAPEGSDDALAEAFSERHAGQLLYVAAMPAWLRWDGCRWQKDTTLAVFDLARAVCREAAARKAEKKDANPASIASASTVAAVERLARSDRRHARAVEDFDADPWALNTPAGVVNLRTGEMRPHIQGEMVMKVAAVAPGGDCPRWRAFIHEIVQGDAELAAYIQRWAGYMLTGDTSTHAFLVIIGPGQNGKTLLVNVLSYILGDYATTAPMETFMASTSDRHPTDLAGLRGARLVAAQETEAGRALAEAKLKALTGGDKIAARFMRGDFFEYAPQFKLVMVGNHRPAIHNPDDGLRRRLHLLPLTFKPPAPDTGLFDKLKAEAPGILQWAIDGCIAMQTLGLGMPEKVKAATAEYFADQDLFAQWLGERCERDARSQAPHSALFRDWSQWCEVRGEQPGSGKRFTAAMERHHSKKMTKTGSTFIGVRLLPNDTGVC